MKRIIAQAVLATALIGARIQTAQAHDHCVAGAVIGGILAGAVIADALQPHTAYYTAPAYYAQPAPVVYAHTYETRAVYVPATTYYQPAPVVIYREPAVRFGFGYVRPWHHRHEW